jgi:nitrogenase molybdenum-iron protein NifN
MKTLTEKNRAKEPRRDWAQVNPCVCCAPLGAALAFKGIEGGMSLLHGSQGCATYIRRYLISHFREPVDIASSSFTEDTVVFGGAANLAQAIRSVRKTYNPAVLGIATTCLAETIGEDLVVTIATLRDELQGGPVIVPVSTPAYRDGHATGFAAAAAATMNALAQPDGSETRLGILPGMLSPEDLRYCKDIAAAFGRTVTVFPDYSATLDGGQWDRYHALPPGGTPLREVEHLASAPMLFDWTAPTGGICGKLKERFGTPIMHSVPPIGIAATDAFLEKLSIVWEIPVPEVLQNERARLLDAYVDGHKYLSGLRVAVCCDEPLVAGLVRFCTEIGLVPVLVATGRGAPGFDAKIRDSVDEPGAKKDLLILSDADFDEIDGRLEAVKVDLCIGTGKLQKSARKTGAPLVRVGFPIHDRFGANRILHIGYRGGLQLYDRIVNAIIEKKQESSDEHWSYL